MLLKRIRSHNSYVSFVSLSPWPLYGIGIWNNTFFSSSEHCHLLTLLLAIVTNKVLPVTHFCKTESLSEQPGVGRLWWGTVKLLPLLTIITIFICWHTHAVMSFHAVHLSIIPHPTCPTQPLISRPFLYSESSPSCTTPLPQTSLLFCSVIGLVSSNLTISCEDHRCSERRVITKSVLI